MKRILLLLLAIVSGGIAIQAQTIHAILFCNTLDEKIGESCIVDHNISINEISVIAENIGYEIKYYDYYGEECSNENLRRTLSDLNCTSDDIVYFYYSGHGVHAASDPGSLPQMCLKYDSYEQEKFFPVKKVDEMLALKNPRLRLIMTDCCNNLAEWVSFKGFLSEEKTLTTTITKEESVNYKKLFLNNKGSIIVTGSKRGQVSWCTSAGGMFTLSFWETLYNVGTGKVKPEWDTLLQTVKEETLARTENKQEPYFSSNTTAVSGGTVPIPPQSGDNQIVGNDLESLFGAILNQNSSMTERAALAKRTYNTYFSADAKIEVVGRNLTTTVEFEDARIFINDMAISDNIRRVSIIRKHEDENGKIDYMIVHEIH